MHEWALQDAKARLSELVRLAMDTNRKKLPCDVPAVVVISREDYEHLRQSKPNFVEMIRNSPLYRRRHRSGPG